MNELLMNELLMNDWKVVVQQMGIRGICYHPQTTVQMMKIAMMMMMIVMIMMMSTWAVNVPGQGR
jgi:hypothetical protein